jgi:hypothetical protein
MSRVASVESKRAAVDLRPAGSLSFCLGAIRAIVTSCRAVYHNCLKGALNSRIYGEAATGLCLSLSNFTSPIRMAV